MTPNEICRNYRQSKDKKEQIKILADLNCTSKDEIIKVLVDCGEMEPPEEKPKRIVKKKTTSLPELTKPVADALFARIDELDKEIKPLEDKRKALDAQMEPLRIEFNEIVSFLNGYGIRNGERL